MYKDLQVFSLEETQAVAKKDQPLCSSKKTFARDSSLTYYIACNTWVMIVDEYDRYVSIALKERIMRDGLINTIKKMDDQSNLLVHGEELTDALAKSLVRVSKNKLPYDGESSDHLYSSEPMAASLLLLRYLKRFTPVDTDLIQSKTLSEFISVENRNKLTQRREPNMHVLNYVRYEVLGLLDWDALCDEIEALDPRHLEFTPGAAADANSSIGKKLEAIASTRPEFFHEPFGIPYTGARVENEVPWWGTQNQYDQRIVKVRAVPKSYKASRIIAMEQSYSQARAHAISTVIRRHLPKWVDVTDQTRNQALAMMGSIGDDLATLDAEHASDFITKSLVWEIFPERFVKLLEPYIGTHHDIDGRVRLMQMFSTSGNSLTFDVETITYWAIGRAGDHFHKMFSYVDGTGDCNCDNMPDRPFCSAYGDDTIVPKSSAVTVIEFFSALGLKINVRKSFFEDHPYRESCGVEYYDGVECSSMYYPRFPIIGKFSNGKVSLGVRLFRDTYRGKIDDSTTMLIDLQRKLFGLSQRASNFVRSIIKEARPMVTTSPWGSEYPDLWGYDDDASYAPSPKAYQIVKNGDVRKISRVPLPDCMVSWYDENKGKERIRVSFQLRYQLDHDLTEYQRRLLTIYRYQTFLEHGPSYMSPLDKLLGVTSPGISEEQAYGKGILVPVRTLTF